MYTDSPYLMLLLNSLALLSKAKLKTIQKVLKHSNNNIDNIESQLKKTIPLAFLETLAKLKSQVETQQKEISIILSTEFIR